MVTSKTVSANYMYKYMYMYKTSHDYTPKLLKNTQLVIVQTKMKSLTLLTSFNRILQWCC